ncbi:hypothetical protein FGU65_00330 [Methanoculleus sp. FWC-SCC1]|uniref:MarR family transcriptional regulator n=1 Tax=Methanoculleus frigidifontis TaxID=2584085 RepID=A0ABT8M5Z9_9EURY|nr:hypothetical protein [Methanoculleus sp. FWC-SCC1]MDN7023358.1 hypothetical protein [Methanoculleus sp. FWC-SCC1]
MAEEGGADAPSAVLFRAEIARVHEAVSAYTGESPSHIAVIAEPFAGQQVMMEQITRYYPHRVTHLPFYSVARNTDFLDTMRRTEEIVLMERCHFLALRRVGGFAMLDAFLDFLSMSEKLFITGWNAFTWSYLNAVVGIEKNFPIVIRLPRIDDETLKAMILSRYDHPIRFVDDTPVQEKKRVSIQQRLVSVPFLDAPVQIPWIAVDTENTGSGRGDAGDAVFNRINNLAQGNYGVALRIWERSIEENTVLMSRIPALPCTVSLTIDEAFLLTIILSMESISSADLEAIAHPEIDLALVLYRLRIQGLVEEERGYYQVKPEALHCVSAYLKKIRMVW